VEDDVSYCDPIASRAEAWLTKIAAPFPAARFLLTSNYYKLQSTRIAQCASVQQVTVRILIRLFATLAFTGSDVQDLMIIATAAAIMIPKVAQPKYLSNGGFTRLPITLWLLVRRMTSKIRGGARRPLITADKNSIFTA
jgi:hypothetical protein